MPSSKDLLRRPDIWKADLESRLNAVHAAALEAEDAFAEVETRDASRGRRQALRSASAAVRFPGLKR